MRIKLDTGDIEAFAALGLSLSFKTAADSLAISPSALSRRVQKLEEQLDARLVHRTTRSVRLTVAGNRFLARSREILTQVDELVLAAKGQNATQSSVVTIAAIPSIAHRVLPPALRAFAIKHPTTRVRVRDLTTGDVVEAVSRGDAAFGITSLLQSDSTVAFTPLVKGTFVLIVPQVHPLARRRRVRWDDVQSQRMISTWKGAGVRVALDYDLAKGGAASRLSTKSNRSTRPSISSRQGSASLPFRATSWAPKNARGWQFCRSSTRPSRSISAFSARGPNRYADARRTFTMRCASRSIKPKERRFDTYLRGKLRSRCR